MPRITTIIQNVLLSALFVFCLSIQSSWARIDCSKLSHWAKLNNGHKINLKHVFCGEWSKNRPKGFHARPGGANPTTVRHFTIQDKPNAAGIYTGRWSFQNRASKNKFSSMFPDDCSSNQILNSITYASSHPKKCPAGSPHWLSCGSNKPNDNHKIKSKYCSVNNQLFIIGFAPPRRGKINTAFPLYK